MNYAGKVVEGFSIGHAHNLDAKTGCTVILCPDGAAAGVDVRGIASGTRELDPATPHHLVPAVNGILLSGGSAYGLDAAGGVMRYLEEKGFGYEVGTMRIPIVPSAIIFDLNFGNGSVRPDQALAYEACRQADAGQPESGSVGVGTGATVGKILGIERAMKSGVGVAVGLLDDAAICAVMAVNAYGDVYDQERGQYLAGTLDPARHDTFLKSAQYLCEHNAFHHPVLENTTIGAVLTDARFNKLQCAYLAQLAHNSLAAMISPSHTPFDGDTLFVLSRGDKATDITRFSVVMDRIIRDAIRTAVMEADGFGILPDYQSMTAAGA